MLKKPVHIECNISVREEGEPDDIPQEGYYQGKMIFAGHGKSICIRAEVEGLDFTVWLDKEQVTYLKECIDNLE